MTMPSPSASMLGRRNAMLMAGAFGTIAAAPAAPAPGKDARFTEGAALVVAGPPQGRLDRWADLLVPALARLMPGAAALPLLRSTVGGDDGVTGANLFEARVQPDGGTALLLPGSAALAWLVGDRRAQFDAARWVPAWAGLASAVLVSRVPLDRGRTIRIGGVQPAGAALPMLLALDIMGIEVTPGADSSADAVFHYGQGARAAAMAQESMGRGPVLTLGAMTATGTWGRDPAFPAVPTALEAAGAAAPAPDLMAALRATAAATMLDVALVLPRLSPANRVALWRRACTEASAGPVLVSEAAALGIRPAPQTASAALIETIASDVPTLLALRTWLDRRWGWRPT